MKKIKWKEKDVNINWGEFPEVLHNQENKLYIKFYSGK